MSPAYVFGVIGYQSHSFSFCACAMPQRTFAALCYTGYFNGYDMIWYDMIWYDVYIMALYTYAYIGYKWFMIVHHAMQYCNVICICGVHCRSSHAWQLACERPGPNTCTHIPCTDLEHAYTCASHLLCHSCRFHIWCLQRKLSIKKMRFGISPVYSRYCSLAFVGWLFASNIKQYSVIET